MPLLTKGIELIIEIRARDNQLREEGRKEGGERKEAEIRNRLRQRGLDLDELLRANDGDETAAIVGDETAAIVGDETAAIVGDETAAIAGDETANPLPCDCAPRHCAPAASRIYSIHIHTPGVPTHSPGVATPNYNPTAGRL